MMSPFDFLELATAMITMSVNKTAYGASNVVQCGPNHEMETCNLAKTFGQLSGDLVETFGQGFDL